MCIPAPAITCVRTHHAQYQKKTNESFWYCAWCLRTHVIAGAGRHFPVLLPPSTLHTRQKVLKTEQIWTSIRGWTKSKILVRKTTRGRTSDTPFLSYIYKMLSAEDVPGMVPIPHICERDKKRSLPSTPFLRAWAVRELSAKNRAIRDPVVRPQIPARQGNTCRVPES